MQTQKLEQNQALKARLRLQSVQKLMFKTLIYPSQQTEVMVLEVVEEVKHNSRHLFQVISHPRQDYTQGIPLREIAYCSNKT